MAQMQQFPKNLKAFKEMGGSAVAAQALRATPGGNASTPEGNTPGLNNQMGMATPIGLGNGGGMIISNDLGVVQEKESQEVETPRGTKKL